LSLELALAEVLDSPAESHQVAAPRQTPPKPAATQRAESKPEVKSEAKDSALSAVEVQAPAEKPVLNSADIIKAWKSLAASLPKAQANLSALLNSVRMIDIQGKTLLLGLASEVLVEKLDKPDQVEAIQKLIKDSFNVDIAVRCIVTNAKGKIPANVPQDGMVATAIQHGGEIVDMDE
jgi:hypothetical protein